MNVEERDHAERLLHVHRTRLRELEVKAAKYGDLDTPAHIIVELRDLRGTVEQLESELRAALPRHNLPPRDYERFVGRQKELAELRRLLTPRSRAFVVTIDGIGGIGKSALALEAAYSYRHEFADLPKAEQFEAIVWVSAKRSYLTADGILERRQAFRTLDDLYIAIAQVLDYPAITRARTEERHALVEQALGEQRTLLIIDNLETVDDEDLLVFLRELPDPTKAIVTTRHRIDVAYPVRLTGMPQEDAIALIAQEAERKGVALAPDDVEALWQRTGGVPLALVWSIGLMGLGGSVESVLRRLGSGQSDIARFCFEESIGQIRGSDAHKLLMAMHLFPGDTSREAVGVTAGLGEDYFGRDTGLEQLLRLSLINKEKDRFSLLPLTRIYVQHVNQAEWQSDMEMRYCYYYFAFVEERNDEDRKSRMDRMEQELFNIISSLDIFKSQIYYRVEENNDPVIQDNSVAFVKQIIMFLGRVVRVCRNRGYWMYWEKLSKEIIDLATLVSDYRSIGYQSFNLSRLYNYRGNISSAREWAVEAERYGLKTNDIRIVCQARRRLGLLLLDEGKTYESEQLLGNALEDARSQAEEHTIAPFLTAMGHVFFRKGNLNEACTWYQQAVDVSRQRQDKMASTVDLLYLGQVRQHLNATREAQELYLESYTVAREEGVVDVLAQALYHLAELDYLQQDRETAMSKCKQALETFRRLGMKREQAEAEALLAKIAAESQSTT